MKRKQKRDQERQELPELMSFEEVAAYLGVKRWRVRWWTRHGWFTPVRTLRGELRYMRMEVEHLAAMYGG